LAKDIHYVRGIAHWAKVIGEPKKDNFSDGRQWSIDVSLDDEGVKLFKELRIGDRIREPKEGDTRAPFYTFKQAEFRRDGQPNDPITIVDTNNRPWPEGKLIGNGSVVDIKFKFVPASGAKKAGAYIRAIRVLEHVPYQSSEFAPLSSDDEYFGSSETPEFEKDFGLDTDSDLDDDIPE